MGKVPMQCCITWRMLNQEFLSLPVFCSPSRMQLNPLKFFKTWHLGSVNNSNKTIVDWSEAKISLCGLERVWTVLEAMYVLRAIPQWFPFQPVRSPGQKNRIYVFWKKQEKWNAQSRTVGSRSNLYTRLYCKNVPKELVAQMRTG